MFSRSTDAGETFSPPSRVSRGPGSASESNIATDSSGKIHVVWVDTTGGDPQALYSKSTDGGDTFSDPINLSSIRGGEVHKPIVTASRNRVYVAFNEDLKNKQVFLVTSDNGGTSFGDIVQVSAADPAKGRAHSPAMVIDPDQTLHIVWIDSSILGSDEGLLYYTTSNNGTRFNSKKPIYAFLQN
jgi:hypothetical protein